MTLLNTKRKKITLTVTLSLAVIAALFWFTLFFQKRLVVEMSEAVQREKLDSFVLKEKRDKISKLKKELADAESRKKEMENMLPGKDNVVPVLQSLEKIASETLSEIKVEAVDISKIKFSKTKKTAASQNDEESTKSQSAAPAKKTKEEQASQDELAKIKKFPAFSLTITGSYLSLVDFIDKMESLPYFIRVLTIDITSGDKEKKKPNTGGILPAASSDIANSNMENTGKETKMTLLVVVYTNE